MRRVALVLLVALAPGSAPASAGWSVARAERALRSGVVAGEDASQADHPVFEFSLAGLPLQGRLRREGPWRFRYAGPAADLDGGGTIRVSFSFVPDGAGGVLAEDLRGPPPDASQPGFPLRAAFYYGWFPENWFQDGYLPFTRYQPAGGLYDSLGLGVAARQIAAMRYGGIAAGIYSWWGRGTPTDTRFPIFLQAARQTPFRWAVYYEAEGYGDPSVEQIRADLEYIRDAYGSKPAYLRIGGRFAVFVYGGREDCSVADRWTAAAAGIGAYLVLPAFAGFRDCAHQPDSWLYYSASIPEFELHGYSFGVCPGFWRVDQAQPRLARDLDRFRQDVRDMVASREPLQLVLTFNEWGEGTAVEPADEWASASGYGAYLDVLHDDGLGSRGR